MDLGPRSLREGTLVKTPFTAWPPILHIVSWYLVSHPYLCHLLCASRARSLQLHFPGSIASWVPVRFCQWEALGYVWRWEEGRNSFCFRRCLVFGSSGSSGIVSSECGVAGISPRVAAASWALGNATLYPQLPAFPLSLWPIPELNSSLLEIRRVVSVFLTGYWFTHFHKPTLFCSTETLWVPRNKCGQCLSISSLDKGKDSQYGLRVFLLYLSLRILNFLFSQWSVHL